MASLITVTQPCRAEQAPRASRPGLAPLPRRRRQAWRQTAPRALPPAAQARAPDFEGQLPPPPPPPLLPPLPLPPSIQSSLTMPLAGAACCGTEPQPRPAGWRSSQHCGVRGRHQGSGQMTAVVDATHPHLHWSCYKHLAVALRTAGAAERADVGGRAELLGAGHAHLLRLWPRRLHHRLRLLHHRVAGEGRGWTPVGCWLVHLRLNAAQLSCTAWSAELEVQGPMPPDRWQPVQCWTWPHAGLPASAAQQLMPCAATCTALNAIPHSRLPFESGHQSEAGAEAAGGHRRGALWPPLPGACRNSSGCRWLLCETQLKACEAYEACGTSMPLVGYHRSSAVPSVSAGQCAGVRVCRHHLCSGRAVAGRPVPLAGEAYGLA